MVPLCPVGMRMGVAPGVGSRAWCAYTDSEDLARSASFVMPPVSPVAVRRTEEIASPEDVEKQKAVYAARLVAHTKQMEEVTRTVQSQQLEAFMRDAETQRAALENQIKGQVEQLQSRFSLQLSGLQNAHAATQNCLEHQAAQAVQQYTARKGEADAAQREFEERKAQYEEHIRWCEQKAKATVSIPAKYSSTPLLAAAIQPQPMSAPASTQFVRANTQAGSLEPMPAGMKDQFIRSTTSGSITIPNGGDMFVRTNVSGPAEPTVAGPAPVAPPLSARPMTTPQRSQLSPGDMVEGLWEDGIWYNAQVEAVHGDGTYSVIWTQDGTWSQVPAHELRRVPGILLPVRHVVHVPVVPVLQHPPVRAASPPRILAPSRVVQEPIVQEPPPSPCPPEPSPPEEPEPPVEEIAPSPARSKRRRRKVHKSHYTPSTRASSRVASAPRQWEKRKDGISPSASPPNDDNVSEVGTLTEDMLSIPDDSMLTQRYDNSMLTQRYDNSADLGASQRGMLSDTQITAHELPPAPVPLNDTQRPAYPPPPSSVDRMTTAGAISARSYEMAPQTVRRTPQTYAAPATVLTPRTSADQPRHLSREQLIESGRIYTQEPGKPPQIVTARQL